MVLTNRSIALRALLVVLLIASTSPATATSSIHQGRTSAGTAPTATPPLDFDFRVVGYGIRDLPREAYPYARRSPVARVDTEPHDRRGVRMVRINGRMYDHPVLQASYGLVNLESYRITKDSFYLGIAEAQAARLMQRARNYGGGWYLPYPFSFDLHGVVSERIYAPWYSAMAQGQALSLFVRLNEVTGDSRYRAAANRVFATFLRPRGRAMPWTVWVDHAGYLWLEEYAGPRPDRTYNGQMFAAWGLWDYWRLTADQRARRMWDGALTTVVAYAPTIRNAGWVSSYCISHPWSMHVTYHMIHISQLVSLYSMSSHPSLARYAEALFADYPPTHIRGSVSFAAGRHLGYRFDAAGRVTRRSGATLTRTSSAPANGRTRIKGQPGIWYRITAGAFAGSYVQERPGVVVLRGRYLPIAWTPARTGRLSAGRVTVGHRFTTTGAVVESRSVRPATSIPFKVTRTEHWNAVRYALAADGPLAGFWVPLSTITRAENSKAGARSLGRTARDLRPALGPGPVFSPAGSLGTSSE